LPKVNFSGIIVDLRNFPTLIFWKVRVSLDLGTNHPGGWKDKEMKALKEITLSLNLENQRDKNIYEAIKTFGEKHDIMDESESLKALMHYMRFIGADELTLIERAQEASRNKRISC